MIEHDEYAEDPSDDFWASTMPAEDENVFADYTDEQLDEIMRKSEARVWEVTLQERARGIAG